MIRITACAGPDPPLPTGQFLPRGESSAVPERDPVYNVVIANPLLLQKRLFLLTKRPFTLENQHSRDAVSRS